MKPFLKWAGGKYKLVEVISQYFPQGNRFVEPFLGAGSMALNVDYPEYLVADANKSLIKVWQSLSDVDSFINKCRSYFVHNTEDKYYYFRELFNETNDPALFVYLNRHGFNGLCRFNKSGKFNVPYGFYKTVYFPELELRNAALKSKNMMIKHQSFSDTFAEIKSGDVVYCDPPYVPLSATSSFDSYSAGGFPLKMQEQLLDCAWSAVDRGATVIISNHDTPLSRKLYKNAEIHTLDVQRNISCKGDSRGKAKELIAVFKKS